MFRALWILSAILAVGQTGTARLFLDLTTPQVERMEKAHKVGCSGGGGVFVTGRPYQPPRVTLRLEIARLSAHNFVPGRGFVADLQLTNTGDKAIKLPWNPDEYVIYGKNCKNFGRPSPSPTLVGSLSLKLLGTAGQSKFVGGHDLYARMDQPATYRVLQPEQSAVIRVGGKFYPPRGGKGAKALTGSKQFKLLAVFDLTDSRIVNPYQTVTSENSVVVTSSSNK